MTRPPGAFLALWNSISSAAGSARAGSPSAA